MALQQRWKKRSYEWLFENLTQGLRRQQRNQVGDEPMIWSGLDHHGELHRGRFHFDRSFSVRIECTVDDVGPVDEIGDGCGVESEAFVRDHRDKTGTRFEIGIVELAVALILLEMFGVGRRKKGAL